MVLKFKDRESPKNRLKIHVCGLTGCGKSTFAEEYCKQAGLNPIVVDIDDTNYSTQANPDVDFIGSDRQIFTKICNLLDEINKTDFDTIIYDGWDSSMEKITPKEKDGNPFYHLSVRKQRCEMIMNRLLNSGKHLIFIGQVDTKIVDDPKNKPSYPVKVMNNCVNVSYFCYVTKDGEFLYDIMKNRFGDRLSGLNVFEPIPYIVKQEKVEPIVQKPKKDKLVENNVDESENLEVPRLIQECVDTLVRNGRNPTNDVVRICIEDRCKDQEEHDLCMKWLDENINLGGIS